MKYHLFIQRLEVNFSILAAMLISLAITSYGICADAGAVLIVNSNVQKISFSKTDVMNIFLGKKTTWDDGSKITFVTLKGGDAHKKFLRTYIKRNPTQFKNYWKKMLFTGKGVVPKSFAADADVIDYISKNVNTVGYISTSVSADGIKIIPVSE